MSTVVLNEVDNKLILHPMAQAEFPANQAILVEYKDNVPYTYLSKFK